MPFPDESLDLTVEAFLAGAWQDLSDRLMRDPVTITRGRGDGARQGAASSCRLVLDNDDGALMPLWPLSQWYPEVRRGVPFRVSVRRFLEMFDRTASDSWGNDWTIAGGSTSDFYVTGGVGVHQAQNEAATKRSLRDGPADMDIYYDVSIPEVAPVGSISAESALLVREDGANLNFYALRVLFEPGGVLEIRIAKRVAGVETNILNPPGGQGTYSGGSVVHCHAQIKGAWLRMSLWVDSDTEPTQWQAEVEDTTFLGAGRWGFRSSLGDVPANWTGTVPLLFSYDNVQLRVSRFRGRANSYHPVLKPRTDGTMISAVQIELGGIIRRLGRGQQPFRPALKRAILASAPAAFWPMDDAAESTQVASAVPGGTSMTGDFTEVEFGVVTDVPAGSLPLLQMPMTHGTTITGAITGATAGEFRFGCLHRNRVPIIDVTTEIRVAVSGTSYEFWELAFNGTGQLLVIGAPGGAVVSAGSGLEDGLWHWYEAHIVDNGANVDVDVYIDGVLAASDSFAGNSGRPVAGLITVSSDPVDDPDEVAQVGAFTVWTPQPPGTDIFPAVDAYAGESAGRRIERLCDEGGIAISLIGDPDTTMPMGPQGEDTFLALAREGETADSGILSEGIDDEELVYRARSDLYNQTPALTVDLATYRTTRGTSADVLAPVYDDQQLRNDVEATRRGGSSARVVDQESIDLDQRYDEQLSVNVASDVLLDGIASWHVHLGTVDELRNPSLALDLAANPELVDDWLAVALGDRIQRLNPPAPHPPGPIDQLLDGYTETLAPKAWTVRANCSPAATWDVAVYGTSRYESRGTFRLSPGPIDETNTAITFTITAGRFWRTTGPFPFDINLNGEQVTVNSIDAPSGNTQLFHVTRSVNGVVKSHPVGTQVRLWKQGRYAL